MFGDHVLSLNVLGSLLERKCVRLACLVPCNRVVIWILRSFVIVVDCLAVCVVVSMFRVSFANHFPSKGSVSQ